MEINAPLAAQGQVTVAGAQARISELVVGQLYRVTVTDSFPGKVEILLGNRYLLAATNFKFTAGDQISLKLVERTPQLLTFQLTLPGEGEAQQLTADLGTLLRAGSLADTTGNRAVLTMLLRGGVPVTTQSMGEIGQLVSALPPEVVAGFLPLYKELLDKQLNPDITILRELANLTKSSPELAGMLTLALVRLRGQRVRSGRRKGALEAALEGALTVVDEEERLPTAAMLKQRLEFLYGSPEKALRDFLAGLPGPAEPGDVPLAGEGRGEAVLRDLVNYLVQEGVARLDVSPELAALVNTLQALRIRSAMDKAKLGLALPLNLAGEPTDVQLTLQQVDEQYYQKDYAMRVRVKNRTQGEVEFQIKTRGPGLSVDILVDRPETLGAYEEELERFRQDLAQDSGFLVRGVEVGQHSL